MMGLDGISVVVTVYKRTHGGCYRSHASNIKLRQPQTMGTRRREGGNSVRERQERVDQR